MSLKNDDRYTLEVIFERLLTGLRHQSEFVVKETSELDKQGTVIRGKGRGKQKQFISVDNALITMNHSDKDEDMFPIDENSLLESFHGAQDPKGQLYLHFVTGDKQKELWIACSNAVERDAWEDCLRKNILVAQLSYMVTESYVKRAIKANLHSLLNKAQPKEFAEIDKAMSEERFCVPGRVVMYVDSGQRPKAPISAKEAKKLEKEQEKEKKKAEKEQKEREKAEKKKK